MVSCPQYDLIERSQPFHTPLQSKSEPVEYIAHTVIIYIDDNYCIEQYIDCLWKIYLDAHKHGNRKQPYSDNDGDKDNEPAKASQ